MNVTVVSCVDCGNGPEDGVESFTKLPYWPMIQNWCTPCAVGRALVAADRPVVKLPADRAEGRIVFVAVIPFDVLTGNGNVAVRAGRYEAIQSEGPFTAEGNITVWSPDGYLNGIATGLQVHHWCFPGESPRPWPAHDCIDELRSGVAGGVYCGVCMHDPTCAM